ncbi:hypothetical protein [Tenacibaculum ascidiaceicola]|uniref:hypothetical protein n=1 Tax=Tenacibaculum ascidiaceicola TaxID=1699411 RepID=UPI003CE519E9
MSVKYPNAGELAKRFGVDKTKFHRKIKPIIVNDYKFELNKKGIKNPDIGIDSNNIIYLRSPKDIKIEFCTNITINNYP